MDKKDIIIVDHISMLTQTKIDCRKMEEFTIKMLNVRKYRGKIERRKLKINKIYE
jgi:hypothetical protein